MKSKFGNEEDNFPFRFATKVSEENLKLLGFPDEAVDGWEITPLRTPLVVSNHKCYVFCVCGGGGCFNKKLYVNYMNCKLSVFTFKLL